MRNAGINGEETKQREKKVKDVAANGHPRSTDGCGYTSQVEMRLST